jgi:hypothetical protein
MGRSEGRIGGSRGGGHGRWEVKTFSFAVVGLELEMREDFIDLDMRLYLEMSTSKGPAFCVQHRLSDTCFVGFGN